MDKKEIFINQIKANLEKNGFPKRKVSFDVELMYELADNKGLSFNSILENLKEHDGIDFEISTDKVIFSAKLDEKDQGDMFAQAQEMLAKMNPEEIQNLKEMYENMSSSQKDEMLKQAKDMGIKE
jgi:hypothetical protein